MHQNMRVILAGCLIFLYGCGPNDPKIATPDNQGFTPVNSSEADLKARLKNISETGDGGSALMGLSESIEANVTNAEIKAALLRDAHQLDTLSDPEKIKLVAKGMFEKLNTK